MDSIILTQPAPLTRRITDDGRLLNALDRARDLGHNARRINDNHFVVYSASNDGSQYDVFVTNSGLKCSCKAGQFSRVCKHAAKVGLRLQRERDARRY